MGALTGTELGYLRANGQRYRLYLAKWGTWEIQQSTPLLTDATTDPPTLNSLGVKTQANFAPVVNIGSHRLGFVGESVPFDCTGSFAIHGGALGAPAWVFPSATPATSTATTPAPVWSSPGLYEITCAIDGTTAKRWVRVLADRTHTTYDVIQVASLSGSTSGGWKSSITAAPSDDAAGTSSEVLDVADFQAMGLFIEEEYEDSGWTRASVSGYALDPTLLMSGYIEQGSIHIDANNHTVQFQLGSVADQMNIGFVHSTQTWNKVYIDADIAGPHTLPNPVQGVILDMSPDLMVMPDILIWWLQTYTDVLERHDFYTWYDASQQELDTISTSEGALWSAVSALADNEFAWWFADQGNGIHFEPNPHIRSTTWWNTTYPVRMTFTDADAFTYEISQEMQRNIIWAQVTGTQVRTGKQWTKRYPGPTPGAGAGSWYMKNDLNVSRESFLTAIIHPIYNDQNRKINVSITTGLNRALRVPDRIQISADIPDRGITWVNKVFSVASISYAINVPAGQFTTQIQAMEFVS